MKVTKGNFAILFLNLLIILSCSQVNENQQNSITADVNNFNLQESTNKEIPVIAETATSINNDLFEKCFEGITEIGMDKNISGTIVLYIDDGLNRKGLLFYDTELHEAIQITPQNNDITMSTQLLNGVTVSPDGNYLAYQTRIFSDDHNVGNKINIVNSENEIITEINNSSTSEYFEWLDDDNLIINTFQENNPVIIDEIFSGEQKLLYPILGEGISDIDYINSWFFYGVHKNIYNSDLSRVIYPSSENGLPVAILRNMDNNSDITTIQTKIGYGSSPVWSPDGNNFAIAVADDRNYSEDFIYIFNRNGEIIFQTDKSSTKMLEQIYSMSWSPNSKLLAFIYAIEKSSVIQYQLGILDIEEMKITTYCSPDVFLSVPYWSPDNEYILYLSKDIESEEVKSLAINLETGQSYLVMDGYYPGGWMK